MTFFFKKTNCVNFLTDPLEQFEIFLILENILSYWGRNFIFHTYSPCPAIKWHILQNFLKVGGNLIANNFNIFLFFILFGLAGFLMSSQFNIIRLSNLRILNKKSFKFIKTIVQENMELSAQKHFPLIYYIFLSLLLCNMVGMIPYSFTITSSFVFTLFLSLGFFIGANIIGISMHGFGILKLFLPGGAPVLIMPALVLIEILSYFARIFSLSIRLFANMMSGHTLLKILAGFSWNMFNAKSWLLSIFFLVPLFIVFLVTGLELAIAFLQAYVFTVLICIYLNDVFAFH